MDIPKLVIGHRRDSNPTSNRHQTLKLVRLPTPPIRHLSRIVSAIVSKIKQQLFCASKLNLNLPHTRQKLIRSNNKIDTGLIFQENSVENLIQDTSTKLKKWLALFQSQRQVQYGVLVIYLLLWLFSSGSLSTTIWVGVGVALGWVIGRDSKQEL